MRLYLWLRNQPHSELALIVVTLADIKSSSMINTWMGWWHNVTALITYWANVPFPLSRAIKYHVTSTLIQTSQVKSNPDLDEVSSGMRGEGKGGNNDHLDQWHALLWMRRCAGNEPEDCWVQSPHWFWDRVCGNSLSFDIRHTAGSGNAATTWPTVGNPRKLLASQTSLSTGSFPVVQFPVP